MASAARTAAGCVELAPVEAQAAKSGHRPATTAIGLTRIPLLAASSPPA